jgi:hypothetical protein
MFGSILPLMRMAGFGRRRRRGGRKMLIQGSGRRRRRTGMRRYRRGGRRMRGRGIFDTIKNIGKKAFNIARSVPIISTGLKLAGQDEYSDAAKKLGFGRRRRRYGGRMSVYGGRRRRYRRRTRRYRRRTRRGGRRRPTKRRFSVFGGRKLMGIIPLARGMGRRRRYRRKRRVGGRRRTYRIGLFSRRRR